MIETETSRSGIDGATMLSADDGFRTKMVSGSMDLRKLVALIVSTYFAVVTALIVPGAIIGVFFTLMLPALCISSHLFNWIDHRLCRMVNNHWVSAMQITGTKIIEYGDDISEISEKRVLLLANHLCLTDHFVIMAALRDKGTIVEKYLWVIFGLWKMTPLGAMWLIHGNFFINGGPSKRERVLDEFKDHIRKNYWKYDHRWIIMYPEGSRLHLIKDSNARYAKKHGYKIFKHCALPRVGAAHSTLAITMKPTDKQATTDEAIKKPIEYVVDCTLGYKKDEIPSVGSWMLGEFPEVIPNVAVHYKIIPVKSEWHDQEKFKEWLYKLYEEKDVLLDRYYNDGVFPSSGDRQPRVVDFSLQKCLAVEVFWLLLFYTEYLLIFKPIASILLQYLTYMF